MRLNSDQVQAIKQATQQVLGEPAKSQLDHLAFAERMGLLTDADAFIAARGLRNALVHEYMHDAHIFLENLLAANPACELFFNIIELIGKELRRLAALSS